MNLILSKGVQRVHILSKVCSVTFTYYYEMSDIKWAVLEKKSSDMLFFYSQMGVRDFDGNFWKIHYIKTTGPNF